MDFSFCLMSTHCKLAVGNAMLLTWLVKVIRISHKTSNIPAFPIAGEVKASAMSQRYFTYLMILVFHLLQ